MMESLLFEGPIGRMRPEDVLQFVAQSGGAMQVAFAQGALRPPIMWGKH